MLRSSNSLVEKRRRLQERYEEKRILTENTPSVKRMVPGAEDDIQNTIVTKKRRMNQMVIDTFFKTGAIVGEEISEEMSDRLDEMTDIDIVTRVDIYQRWSFTAIFNSTDLVVVFKLI